MAKYLVDIDDKALIAAKSELGTRTLKDTDGTIAVSAEIERRCPSTRRFAESPLDETAGWPGPSTPLAKAKLADRSVAWR